jgi:hypothetical protein
MTLAHRAILLTLAIVLVGCSTAQPVPTAAPAPSRLPAVEATPGPSTTAGTDQTPPAVLANSAVGVAAQDEAPSPQLPVEFTGHVTCGDQVRANTSETDVGGGFLVRNRGAAWHQAATMSDSRMEGDYYVAFDDDQFVSPAGSRVGSGTWRIENDEGAWQGSYTRMGSAERASVVSTVLVGEGAYEGLTAVWESAHDPIACDWDVWGLIIEGDVPAAPEPFRSERPTPN